MKPRKPHSQETKDKLSNSLKSYFASGGVHSWKGRSHTEDTRRKISLAKKGKKIWTEADKKQMSLTRRGKKRPPRTEEWRLRQREAMIRVIPRGEKSPWWKGGDTLPSQVRKCYKYRQWRSDVFTRDDFTCQICMVRGGDINADHIESFQTILDRYRITCIDNALDCEELWNINNGRTLCIPCHRKTDTYGKRKK